MTTDPIIQTVTAHPPVSKGMFYAGVAITCLVVLFLAFDGIAKILRVAPVIEACQKMGINQATTVGIGIVLVACTALYATPRTAILGALLLTGYLGGAVATHIIQHTGVFAVMFSTGVGVLVWAGLCLREPRLIKLIFHRKQ